MADLLRCIRDADADACGKAAIDLQDNPDFLAEAGNEPEATAFKGLILACIYGDGAVIERSFARLVDVLKLKGYTQGIDGITFFMQTLQAIILQSNWKGLRNLFERSTQRNDWLVSLSQIFSALEERLARTSVEPPSDGFNYSDSSYLAWRDGLKNFADGNLAAAEERLAESRRRYFEADLVGDMMWSQFDLSLVNMTKGSFRVASDLVRSLLPESQLRSPFRQIAQRFLTAFVDMDLAAWKDAITDAEQRDEFSGDYYADIFRVMELSLTERRRNFGYMVCEPASAEMVDELRVIAEQVRLPSQPPEKARLLALTERSGLTIAGELAWSQGVLYLAARRPSSDEKSRLEVVGTGQITVTAGEGGYWRKKRIARSPRRPGSEASVIFQEFLVFQRRTERDFSFELAGNSVRRDQRSQRVGRFMTESRVLFLKLYGSAILKTFGLAEERNLTVYANLLPPRINDYYPFFESIVRPLIDNMPYEDADRSRYAGLTVLEDLLSSTGARDMFPDTMVPLPLLSEDLRRAIGTVRDETRPAQAALERFGFRRSDKFDTLDAGQFFEIELSQLVRVAETHELTAVRGTRRSLSASPEAFYATLAPAKRNMSEFASIRALVRVGARSPDQVEVDEAAGNAIGLGLRESVLMLHRARPKPLTQDDGL
ncbi:MAG: arginine N-succinyltransferase [Nitrospira sp.]|nr:arginine N-succinyltransferase [Nitrospira sp.]